MRRIIFTFLVLLSITCVSAQYAVSHTESVRTPMMMLNDDWAEPAVMVLGSDDVMHFSFDEMSHVYHRYMCRITHRNADGSRSELPEIEYLDGFNDFVIESWENSHRKLCYVSVHVHVDGDDGMGNKWEDTKERELSSLFTQRGRQHYTVGKRIGSWFSAA